MAEAVPSISPVTADVFKTKNFEIELNKQYTGDTLSEDGTRLVLTNPDTISKILSRLGRGIQQLTIENRWAHTDSADIQQLIQRYTSDSLKALKIFEINKHSFEHYTIPFEKLEKLYVGVPSSSTLNGAVNFNMPFNQLFPNLISLSLSINSDPDFIDSEFPHLEHVELNSIDVEWHQLRQLKGFIAKNSQIKSVRLWTLPEILSNVSTNIGRALKTSQ